MKLMTAKDLFNLKHGDRVHRFNGLGFKKLYFVGFMPNCERYLIFCKGEYLTHLYIREDNQYHDKFYSGKYNSKFVGQKMIESLENKIKLTKEIYIDD